MSDVFLFRWVFCLFVSFSSLRREQEAAFEEIQRHESLRWLHTHTARCLPLSRALRLTVIPLRAVLFTSLLGSCLWVRKDPYRRSCGVDLLPARLSRQREERQQQAERQKKQQQAAQRQAEKREQQRKHQQLLQEQRTAAAAEFLSQDEECSKLPADQRTTVGDPILSQAACRDTMCLQYQQQPLLYVRETISISSNFYRTSATIRWLALVVLLWCFFGGL